MKPPKSPAVRVQPANHRCEDCGAQCIVAAASPYEFEWSCACGHAGVIAWARAKPAPGLLAVAATLRTQGTLFDVPQEVA